MTIGGDEELLLRRSLDSNALELILFPTEQCNFRCEYCYESFENGRMKEWVVTAISNLISLREKTLSHLTLSWFGGEPLAAFDVIERISDVAVRTLGRGKVSGNITTNGYFLSVEKAATLLGYGVNTFHVSLDGYGEIHNASRKLHGGGATFGRIWSNLVALKQIEANFDLRLRIHYSTSSADQMIPLIDALNSEFGGDHRVSVYFSPIENYGGPNGRHLKSISPEEKRRIEVMLYEKLGSAVGRAATKNFRDRYVCYAAMGNSLAIRSDGSLAKCTVALKSEINSLGKINENGELTVDDEKYRQWIESSIVGDWSSAACPAKKVVWRRQSIPISVPISVAS
ncbi:radical SAM protein [Variovorax sp. tm]|uniref:radical SAM protein n=1 Tax=Variovorax atrisoli TaxID=3394203 RepID=UPI003A80EAA0